MTFAGIWYLPLIATLTKGRIVFFALSLAGDLRAQARDPDAFAAVLEKLRSAARIPGLSAAVVEDGRVVLKRGFGFANLEERVAAAPDTPYNVASVTKPISAVVALKWDKAYSALYLKVPEEELTLILLANSEGLWWDHPLDKADVEKSPFAAAFLEYFPGPRKR